jgi:YidC/Oxa1 family membrane protein insertase
VERRLLIAFLLSTGLIMAYQIFYYGPRMRRTEELRRAQQARLMEQPVSARETARADSIEPPAVAGDSARMAAPIQATDSVTAAEAGTITVRTPLYEIGISRAGAEVVGVRLLAYETDGEPVQIISGDNRRDGGALRVFLAGDERALSLGGVLFDAYTDRSVDPLQPGDVITVGEATPEVTLVFSAGDGITRVERRFTFIADSYVVRAEVAFDVAGYPFAHRIGWSLGSGLRATEKHTQDDYQAMRASVRLGDEYYKKKRGNLDEPLSGTVQWAALQLKYFAAIMVPETPAGGDARIRGDEKSNFMTVAIELPAAERRGRIEQRLDVYFGPLDFARLKAMGRGLEKTVDVGFDSFKIFKPVSVAVLWSILWLHKVIPNYGLVVIVISVLTKVLFYRLTHKSFKSMRDMQALQPRLQSLKEKHKDDRQKLSTETMRIYKEAGVNPLGGCLPMLLQMPVFIALFNVLRNTIELRGAPFVGWIDDLSQQDVLFDLPFSLPMIGSAVSVMPVLMGASMLVQSKIGGSITGSSPAAAQPKMLMYMLPIVFTVLFYKMPSGLVLYWLVNTVLSVAQQYYINKGGVKAPGEGGSDPAPPTANAKANKVKAKKG